MVLLGLEENILQLSVGRLDVSGLLFQLLESVYALIQELVQSLTLVLVFVPFFLQLLELNIN